MIERRRKTKNEDRMLATVSETFREHGSPELREWRGAKKKPEGTKSVFYGLGGTSGHPKASDILFSRRAVTISVQIGSPGCLMVNLAVAFLSGDVTGS